MKKIKRISIVLLMGCAFASFVAAERTLNVVTDENTLNNWPMWLYIIYHDGKEESVVIQKSNFSKPIPDGDIKRIYITRIPNVIQPEEDQYIFDCVGFETKKSSINISLKSIDAPTKKHPRNTNIQCIWM